MKSDFNSGIWFSYDQKTYHVDELTRKIHWENTERRSCSNCHISIIGMKDNVRVAIRRQKILKRTKKESGNKITMMLGLVVTKIHEPEFGTYGIQDPNNTDKKQDPDKNCWYIKLENKNFGEKDSKIINAYIWKEAKNKESRDSDIDKIFEILQEKQGIPEKESNTFNVSTEITNNIYPVIYQPRTDTANNYITEIYWDKNKDNLEFSIVFKDEQLRRFWILDGIYRKIRRWKYGRIQDLESIIVNTSTLAKSIQFADIYSDSDDLKSDSKHGDNTFYGLFSAKKRPIKYFYSSHKHPIIFVNTANHAMGEGDNNKQFWKWEYAGWEKDSPFKIEQMSRKAVDDMLKKRAKNEKNM